jgi:hypothetical protein
MFGIQFFVSYMPFPQSPLYSEQPSYFAEDGYAKHLIGNAFSVPVVAIFLRPLKDLFGVREYTGYTYEFPWMEDLLDGVDQSQDEAIA